MGLDITGLYISPSLIRPRELNMNQRGGGANVQSCDIQTLINLQSYDIQAHLGLGIQPDNVAHIIPMPKPQATFKPSEQKIFISPYHPHLLGHTW